MSTQAGNKQLLLNCSKNIANKCGRTIQSALIGLAGTRLSHMHAAVDEEQWCVSVTITIHQYLLHMYPCLHNPYHTAYPRSLQGERRMPTN
jgi:hypothetical protein